MYTLSDLDYVPQAVGTDSRYQRFPTDRSDSPTFSVRRRISDSDIVPNIAPPFLFRF